MERLTEWHYDHWGTRVERLNGKIVGTQMCLNKLAEYEDAEEQGLLLRLPCKVGDTIYKLWYKTCHHGCDYPDSFDCCGCMDECDLERAIFEFKVTSQRWIVDNMDYFGKHVYFLTKEEAERKLAEMKAVE